MNLQNISLGRIGGAVGAIGVILGAIFTIDTRYVHADDFKTQVLQVKNSISDLHRSRLEDEIFKLELIPPQKRTQQDKAMLDRYKGQLKEIDVKRMRQE